MKKLFLAAFLSGFAATWVFAHTNFAMAQDLFMQNRPQEAASYLEISIIEDPSNVVAFLYLGIVYEQLGMLDEAITVYRQVLDRAGNLGATVANNLGNVFFRRGFMDEAMDMYNQAIQMDRTFATAYLGRANIRLQRGELNEAITDYQQYLIFAPRSPQRPQIELLINHIRAEFAEAERQRMVAEETARLALIEAERQRMAAEEAARIATIEAERQRLVAEEIARLEAERRQRLLDDIAASLQAAAEGSQGMTVGAEGVERFEGEFELE